MNKTVLFFLLFFSTSVFSQNYELVKPSQVNYFKDVDNYIHAFKVDSFYVNGIDTIYNSFKRIRHFDSCYADIEAPIFGKNIIKQPNGIYQIVNAEYDTTLIKSNAFLGEKWTCFSNLLNQTIEAECSAVNYEVVNGQMDSVKTISFILKDNFNNIVNSPINNLYLKVSQHYGLISMVDFALFPFVEINGDSIKNQLSLDLILDSNVLRDDLKSTYWFNYDIGDLFIFHIDKNYQSYSYTNDICSNKKSYEILSKTESANSISYNVLEKHLVNCMSGGTYSETNIVWNFTKELYNNTLPFENDSITDRSMYTVKKTIEDTLFLYKYKYRNETFDGGDLIASPCFAGFSYSGYISKKVGFFISTYSGYSTPDETLIYNSELVYYKRGSEEWGTFETVSIKDLENESSLITVYPNPNKGDFNIQFNEFVGHYQLEIYNLLGEKVLRKTINSNTEFISSELTNGIYFLKIDNGEKVLTKRIVIN